MKLVGYTDRWSAQEGESVRFYVSSTGGEYTAQLVRLIHGDTNPHGPGYRSEPLACEINGRHPGRVQAIHPGSYIRVETFRGLDPARGFACVVHVRATAVARGEQGLITRWDAGRGRGFGLFINAAGFLEARLALEGGGVARATSQRTLRPHDWYGVALSYDPRSARLELRTTVVRPTPLDAAAEVVVAAVAGAAALCDAPLLLGAGALAAPDDAHALACFNGKLSRPVVLGRPLEEGELPGVLDAAGDLGPSVLARWDLARDPALRVIHDAGPLAQHGRSVNRPTRLVTGHNWRAGTDAPADAPDEYNAVHFHDDDLEDARWQESFRLRVPPELRSGIYAVELRGPDGSSDCLPFFVRPPTGKPSSKVAVLIPTLSYLAYANEALDIEAFGVLATLCPLRNMHSQTDEYAYIEQLWLKSTYNAHRDGSGICHATMLRPTLTSMRPSHRCRLFDGPHQLSADLHLIDWLEAQGFEYDVITDHDLHREGAAVLAPYRTILTGTHAEYWTSQMLDALEAYQQSGGRFIYLSGNGLYWVTALDPETQTVCEIRRTNGTRAWHAAPGEGHLSFTGETGGIWAWRGRAPQRYVGVGFASQGFDRGVPYIRTAASRDPRAAFIFAGIEDELIGDFPSLVMSYGAAGYEVDRADPALGTPPHALVVASSARLSDSYQMVVEDVPAMMPYLGGLTNPNVRADMVFYELPRGGAVFSVGSIQFCSALSYNGYRNNVSRLLANVVRAFMADGPLPGH